MSSSMYVANVESENDQDNERKRKLNNSWKTFRVKQHFLSKKRLRASTRGFWKRVMKLHHFGGGKKSGYKGFYYVVIHIYTLACFTMALTPIYHAFGATLHLAAVLGFLTMGGYMVLSPFAEIRIFRSKLLAVKMHQGGNEMKSMKETSTSIEMVIIMLMSSTCFFILPAFTFLNAHFIKYPNPALQYTFWTSFGMFIIIFPIMVPFGKWQPLQELHMKAVLLAIKIATKKNAKILFDKNLTPEIAREQLGELHERLIIDLKPELKTWSREVEAMTIGSMLQAIVGILLIHGGATGIFDDTIGYPNARFWLGVVLVIVPLMFFKSMSPSAKPHKIYQDFIDEFKNAEKFGCALKKFDSQLGALEKWLKINAISLKLFGMDIDNELPSKIIAGLVSLLGAISLFVYRITVP